MHKLLSSTEVFKHLTNECEFRPISCTESMKEKCKGKQILYKNFLQHLRDTHGIRKIRPTDSCIKRVFNSEAVNQNISWPLFCFEYDGRAFFQHIVLNQLTAYIWVSCFNLPDHVNYIATVVVKNAAANAEVRHSFPVHCFRENFVEVKRSGNFLPLLKEQLMNLATEKARDECERVIHNYSWTSFVNISKSTSK